MNGSRYRVTGGSGGTSYTDEEAQDAVGTILVDTASVDLTYNDGVPSISATVLPAGVDHNSLANLTTGDPHTQYVLESALNELIDDQVAVLIQNGTGISWSYSDVGGTLTPTVTLAPFSTTNLAEGSNLYFTDERAQDAVGSILVDSASVDFTYTDGSNTITAAVLPAGVDHNSLANLTTGDPHTQYILDPGTVTDERLVRWDGTSGRAVQDSAVSLTDAGVMSGATQLNVDNLRLDGNVLSSTSGTLTLTPTTTLVLGPLTWPTADGTANQVLKTNGSGVLSFATLAGTGDVVGPGSSTDNALARFDGTTGKLLQNSVAILTDAGALSGLTGLVSSGLTYPTSDSTLNKLVKTDGAGVLSIGQGDKQSLSYGAGTEGYVLFVDNAGASVGHDVNLNFLFNETTGTAKFGPELADSFNAYSTDFLSRFHALSVSGYAATFVLEHWANDLSVPTLLIARARGTTGRSDVVDADSIGTMFFMGYKTGTYAASAQVTCVVDGTPTIYSIPGRYQVGVTKAGDILPTVVMDMRSDFSTTWTGGLKINTSLLDQDSIISGDTITNLLFIDAGADRVGINTGTPTALLNVEGTVIFNDGGAAEADVRMEGDTITSLFHLDTSTDRIGINTATPSVLFHVNGTTSFDGACVINESGAAVDFRVESDGNANLIFVDGTNNRLGVGTASPTVLFHVNGVSNLDGLTVVNESGTAGNDFRCETDTLTHALYVDSTNNRVGINTSSPTATFNVEGAIIFNDLGADVDIRMEGDTDANMFFLDASTDRIGIGNAAPDSKLHVTGTSHFTATMTTDQGLVRSNWASKTSGYTLTITDYLIEAAPAASGLTITLPAASSAAQGQTWRILSGTAVGAGNAITIQRAGSDTINGGTSVSVTRASVEGLLVRTSSSTFRWYA